MSYRVVDSLNGCILDAWAEESVNTHRGIVSGQDFVELARDEWLAKEQRRRPQDRREAEIVRCEMFCSQRKCVAWRLGLRVKADREWPRMDAKDDAATAGAESTEGAG